MKTFLLTGIFLGLLGGATIAAQAGEPAPIVITD